jgi:hypothetical protein
MWPPLKIQLFKVKQYLTPNKSFAFALLQPTVVSDLALLFQAISFTANAQLLF